MASYKTKVQKFSWGSIHVWMSKASGSRFDDTEGSGYLLADFIFKEKVMERGCALTLKRVYMKDPDTGEVLIDGIASFADSTLMVT